MKTYLKTFSYFLLLAVLLLSCRKKGGDASGNDKDFNISAYLIVGETFWGNNINKTPPYVISFQAAGKAVIYTLEGMAETNYTVTGNRVTLEDMGNIDIENEQVSNMLLASTNLKKGKLVKNNTSENKTYPIGQYMVWSGDGSSNASPWVKDYKVTVAANTLTENWSQETSLGSNNWFPVTKQHSYTPLIGSGGVAYGDDFHLLFYHDPNSGKLVCWLKSDASQYHYYNY